MTDTGILVLGATGMLGHALFRTLSEDRRLTVYATVRTESAGHPFPAPLRERIVTGVDADNPDRLTALLAAHEPDAVINCIGLIKQLPNANDVSAATAINTEFPHRLADQCRVAGARLIHFSTDCVFSGKRGMYREADKPDPIDVYGSTKLQGEVTGAHTITLRTSMIGHELGSNHGLLEWFLGQTGGVKGYARAIFSGLPTPELARIVRDFVIPRRDLSGLYHVSADPISKLDLLRLIAASYHRDIEIVPDDALVIDRSLNSQRFRAATGYEPPDWPRLVEDMRACSSLNAGAP